MNNDQIIEKMLNSIDWDAREDNCFEKVNNIATMLSSRDVTIEEYIPFVIKRNPVSALELIEKKSINGNEWNSALIDAANKRIESIRYDDYLNKFTDMSVSIATSILINDDALFLKYISIIVPTLNEQKDYTSLCYDIYSRLSHFKNYSQYLMHMIRILCENLDQDVVDHFLYIWSKPNFKIEGFSREYEELVRKVLQQKHIQTFGFLTKLNKSYCYKDLGISFSNYINEISSWTGPNLFRALLISEKIYKEELPSNGLAQWYDELNVKLADNVEWNRKMCYAIDVYVNSTRILNEESISLKEKTIPSDIDPVSGKKMREIVQDTMYYLLSHDSRLLLDYLDYLGQYNFYSFNSDSQSVDVIKKVPLDECVELVNSVAEDVSTNDLIKIYMNSFLRSMMPLRRFCEIIARTNKNLVDGENLQLGELFGKYEIPIECIYSDESGSFEVRMKNVYSRPEHTGLDVYDLSRKNLTFASYVGKEGLKAHITREYITTKTVLLDVINEIEQSPNTFITNGIEEVFDQLKAIVLHGSLSDEVRKELLHNVNTIKNASIADRSRSAVLFLESCIAMAKEHPEALAEYIDFSNKEAFFNVFSNTLLGTRVPQYFVNPFLEKDDFIRIKENWEHYYPIVQNLEKRLAYKLYFNTALRCVIYFDSYVRCVEQKSGNINDLGDSIDNEFVGGIIEEINPRGDGNGFITIIKPTIKLFNDTYRIIAQMPDMDLSEAIGVKTGNKCVFQIKSIDMIHKCIYTRWVMTKEIKDISKRIEAYLMKIATSRSISTDELLQLDSEYHISSINMKGLIFSPDDGRNISKRLLFAIKNNIENMSTINAVFDCIGTNNPCRFSKYRIHLMKDRKHIDKEILPLLVEKCNYRLIVQVFLNTYLYYEYTLDELFDMVREKDKDTSELTVWLKEYHFYFDKNKYLKDIDQQFIPRNFRCNNYTIIAEELPEELNRVIAHFDHYDEPSKKLFFERENVL